MKNDKLHPPRLDAQVEIQSLVLSSLGAKMRWLSVVLVSLAALFATPALAEDQIHYGAAPAWVDRQPVPEAGRNPGGSVQLLLLDREVRFDHGVREDYFETAYKVLNTQGLRELGTLGTAWDPETGNLTIHAAQIIRGDQVIDLLAGETKFRVLQRETGLSESLLDGNLTAIREIPDLRVGDVILFATSSLDKQTIENAEPELWAGLGHSGVAAHVRYRAVWPKSFDMRWAATKGIEGAAIVEKGDVRELVYDARDVETPVAPSGAPSRFNTLAELEVSGYKSWSEISSLMAPLYEKASQLNADSPLRAEADRIRRAHDTDEARAAAALSLVEEQIRYLAIVLGQGGLVPVAADVTWDQRFGDCKAKSALLVALLNELGIKATPVVVSTYGGDALPTRLPRIGAFDHVIVRAEIGGRVYWLDGTRTGDRSFAHYEAPALFYGLPLVAGGSELVVIEPTPTEFAHIESHTVIDATAGFTAEGPVEFTQIMRGDAAIAFEEALSGASRREAEAFLTEAANRAYPWLTVESLEFGYDDAEDVYRVVTKGAGVFDWDEVEKDQFQALLGGQYHYTLMTRGAREDKEAPYALPFPMKSTSRFEIRLPPNAQQISYVGPNVDLLEGGVRVRRRSNYSDVAVVMEMTVESVRSEVSAADAKVAKEVFDGAATSTQVSITVAPGEADPQRAEQQEAIRKATADDYAGALEIANRLLRQDPSNLRSLELRAAINEHLGDYGKVLEDAVKGERLKPEDEVFTNFKLISLLHLKRYRDLLDATTAALVKSEEARQVDVVEWHFMRACALVGLRRANEALPDFQTFLDANFFEDPMRCTIAKLDEILADLSASAREDFNAVLSGMPADPAARWIRGALLAPTEPGLALTHYDEAVRLRPASVMLRRGRANLNVKLKSYSAALVDLDWLAERDDQNALVFRSRAQIYEITGDLSTRSKVIRRRPVWIPHICKLGGGFVN